MDDADACDTYHRPTLLLVKGIMDTCDGGDVAGQIKAVKMPVSKSANDPERAADKPKKHDGPEL